MRFDFCIGNPPYQDDTIGNNDSFAPPVYDKFMDAAYTIADKIELIHPARFLFNAGATPKEWNKKILKDEHFKIMDYQPKSSKIFSNTGITGGIVISYYDNNNYFRPINVFTPYRELNSILKKVIENDKFCSFMEIIYVQNRFNLDSLFKDYPEFKSIIGSNGKDKRIRSNSIGKINLFSDIKKNKDDILIYSVYKNKRKLFYFPKKYLDYNHENFDKWKVLVSVANGAAGTLGDEPARIIGEPIIKGPFIGYTQSFIGIGAFNYKSEAEACLKYIKTKFVRCILGVLKVTQNGSKETWAYIPMQDFTNNSDIDWTKDFWDIDLQLYRKYGLTSDEVKFIEKVVKIMDGDSDMERNYKEIVNSVFNAKEKALYFINSRNAVHGLVDLDKSSLDKIEWCPESVLSKSCNFTFELGDGIINEFYDRNFSYDEYFEKNRGISLPIKRTDFSIIVKIQDCIQLKNVEIAKVGIKFSNIFKNIRVPINYSNSDKQILCLKSFEILFSRLLNNSKYYNVKDSSIDIGLIIIDVLEQLSDEVKNNFNGKEL